MDEREDVMSASVDEGDDEEYCNDGSEMIQNKAIQAHGSQVYGAKWLLVHHLICLARRLPGTFDVDTDERRLRGHSSVSLLKTVPLSLRDALCRHRALRAPQERHVDDQHRRSCKLRQNAEYAECAAKGLPTRTAWSGQLV